jgi:hypothetical protein
LKREVRINLTELPENDRFCKSEAAEVFVRYFCERLEGSGLDQAEKIEWVEKLETTLKLK